MTSNIFRIIRILFCPGLLLAFAMPATAQVTTLAWGHGFGDVAFESGNSLVADHAGNVIVTGNFSGTIDFDPGPGVLSLTAMGPDDIFFAKYNALGYLVWAHSVECSSFARSFDVTVDSSDNVYITGYFSQSADFDPFPGSQAITAGGPFDTFIAKYSASGNLNWVRNISSTTSVIAHRIRVDHAGDVIIGGEYKDTTDFDPGINVVSVVSSGNADLFLAKYDAAGNYVWVRHAGGNSLETITGLEVDPNNNIYVGGYFFGSFDFDPGPGVSFLSNFGASDGFFAKFNASGSLTYVKQIGSTGFDQCLDMTLDSGDHILLSGVCSPNADFDPSAAVAVADSVGLIDAFVAKYTPDGIFLLVRVFGSTGIDEANGVAVDDQDNIYLTGVIADTADLDPGPGTAWAGGTGMDDAFITSLNGSGDYRWGFVLGSLLNDEGKALAASGDGGVFVTGGFSEVIDFNPAAGNYPIAANVNSDCFIAKYIPCFPDTHLVQLPSCDSVLYDGLYYQSPGTYTLTYTPDLGCDSVVVLALSIPVFDTSVSVAGITLTSNAGGVTYQWIDCNNGNAPIPGAILASFTPVANGNYAVILSANGCSDTSACIPVTGVGLQELNGDMSAILYPNPAGETLHLELLTNAPAYVKIELLDLPGQVVRHIANDRLGAGKNTLEFSLRELPAGMYLLRVESENEVQNLRVVKR